MNDLEEAVLEYSFSFRHPNRSPIDISERYELFPVSQPVNANEAKWPNGYPFADKFGVYVMYSKEMELIYIGKASIGYLGSRVSAYFGYLEPRNRSSGCKIRDEWSKDPYYIYCLAVPDDSPFEAAALEEYLIGIFQPPENKTGIRR